MLASPLRQHFSIPHPQPRPNHHHYRPSSSSSSSSAHHSYFHHTQYTPCTPPPSNSYRHRSARNSLPTASAISVTGDSNTFESTTAEGEQYMQSEFDFQNPAIRIQQSTPVPQLSDAYTASSMLGTQDASETQAWSVYHDGDGQLDTSALHNTGSTRRSRPHQREASSSSIGSSGSASQYSSHPGQTVYNQGFSNHLPTPSQTPTSDSFLLSNYNNFASQPTHTEPTMAAHVAMKQALMDHHNTADDDVPGFSHSARHSVSSYGHDSPVTPHTTNGDEFEEKMKLPRQDTVHQTIPKFDRTISDIWRDELYNPANAQHMQQAPAPLTKNPSFLSPFRNAVNERLQAAQNARSQSPSSAAASRGVSPFRNGSPYLHDTTAVHTAQTRVPGIGTAASQRESQKEEAAEHALKQQHGNEDPEPKTISPKDALLEFHEPDNDSKAPLFPESGSNGFPYDGAQYTSAPAVQFPHSTDQSFNVATTQSDPWGASRRLSSSNFSTTQASPPQPTFHFAPPSIPGGMMHGLPFNSEQYRPGNVTSGSEQNPEFPSHLTRMESSVSEAGGDNSMPSSQEYMQKPANTTADSGTYTCTYHGCTQRFETPQKLQKHKREGHRQNPAASTPALENLGSGMTSAALLARNSQAGPHRCDRINPTTGKPCNTVFSRPYDLTRHEDTIHNARKQKVRCALCVEEKTFSRNDALTRHMRVVHPEVDFPGKHRRRGGARD